MVKNKQLPVKIEDNKGIDQFLMSGYGLTVNFISESSPMLKLLPFFVIGCGFLYWIQFYVVLAIVIVSYLAFLAILITLKPDRVWSEPTLLKWQEYNLGDSKNKNLGNVQEGEIVQPITVTKAISAKANIKNEIKKGKK